MEQISSIQVIFGSITSILLSIVAYFIKQLHSDFRKMELDLSEVKTMTMLIKTEFNSRYDLLCQRVEYLEKRVESIEHLTFKEHSYESK
ncbi:MAG TPA: hypothetical protein PK796_12375 [Bacteroidales bacterium]|jgi:hypothetical protein|nr:hypothetical protein [Bacteroidales bacterium]